MKKEVSQKFSLLSFIMTCVIVIYHIRITPEFYINSIDNKIFILSNNIFDCLGNIAMGYFFMTTGFFMYRKLTLKNVKEKIKKRIHTLIIPYLIWNLLYFIYRCIAGHNFSIKEIILNLIFDPFDGPLWYILAIFVLALLSPIFIKLFKNKKNSIIILCLIYIVSFYLTSIRQSDVIEFSKYSWYFERLIRYLPNYFTGAIVAIHFSNIIEVTKTKIRKISSLTFILTILLIVSNLLDNNFIWIINKIQPLIIWYMFIPIKENIISKFRLNILFSSSFIIYSLHALLIGIFTKILNIVPYSSNILSGIGAINIRIIMTILIILCSVLITQLLKKISPKLLNILTGGR